MEIMDGDSDIVKLILAECISAGMDQETANKIEISVCRKFGGRRFYVPKRKAKEDQRRMIYRDIQSDKADACILRDHNISRATFYRRMKQVK